jgi:hypothetical protein
MTELSKAGAAPAQLPVNGAVPSKSTMIFRGQVTSKETGGFVPDAFVIKISRQRAGRTVVCASGSGYGTLRDGVVSYRLSLNAPTEPGQYHVLITGAGKSSSIPIADGEIDVN